MEDALAEFNSPGNTLTVAALARKHGISRTTFRRRLAGVSSRSLGHSGQQYLPAAQESALANHVVKLLRGGFAPSVAMVKYLATEIQAGLYPDNKRPVGREWVPRFVGRHSELSLAWSKPIGSKRARAASIEILSAWLKRLEELRIEYDVQPSDIYNMDEKGFILGAADRARVLVRSPNRQTDRQRRAAGNRDFATAVEAVSIDGFWIPPLIIMRGENLQVDLPSKRPKGKYVSLIHLYMN